MYSCCVLCVKYARLQNKRARTGLASDSHRFCSFCIKITVRQRSVSSGFVFPMKNGTRIYIQLFPWLSFGPAKLKTVKQHIFRQFYQFCMQTTVRQRSASGGFVNPMENGTRMCIQIIPCLSFEVRKTANYEISKFHRFRMPITEDKSAIFVFPSKNGTRLYIQMLLYLLFGVGKHVILKLHCFGTRAKRTSTLMWNVS